MKKFLTVVALALMTLTMSAQEESKMSLKAGIGMSSVVGSDADTESVVAYKIGISYDLGITENFSIVPGAEFIAKGFKSKVVDGNINMSYLQIPICAAYKLPLSESMKLVVKAGPYVSYGLFGSDIEFYASAKKVNVFDSDMYDRFDAGIVAGATLDFEQYNVGFEYSRGLKGLMSDFKGYNQVFGIVFGYKF